MTALETSSPCHPDGESLNNKQSLSVIKTIGWKGRLSGEVGGRCYLCLVII